MFKVKSVQNYKIDYVRYLNFLNNVPIAGDGKFNKTQCNLLNITCLSEIWKMYVLRNGILWNESNVNKFNVKRVLLLKYANRNLFERFMTASNLH